MTTKKKPAVAATEPPEGWVHLELAIPEQCWAVYTRAAAKMKCRPQDVVDHILRCGYQGFQKFELEERHLEEQRDANATRH